MVCAMMDDDDVDDTGRTIQGSNRQFPIQFPLYVLHMPKHLVESQCFYNDYYYYHYHYFYQDYYYDDNVPCRSSIGLVDVLRWIWTW